MTEKYWLFYGMFLFGEKDNLRIAVNALESSFKALFGAVNMNFALEKYL